MNKDFAEYIIRNYPHAKKIVEVGIGHNTQVLNQIKEKTKAQVLAVDISPRRGVIKEDVTDPKMEIYEGASLIYSIRPPPEIVPFLEKIARKVGADLIIRPLPEDFLNGKILNYKKAFFYLKRMRCPNCGGELERIGKEWVCPECEYHSEDEMVVEGSFR